MKLDDQMKELIAIGASISANCHPCLEYHVGKAREIGVNESEINEAIEVGKLVRRGAAANMDKLASNLSKTTPKEKTVSSEECGCGK